jgi:hypothetical protein
MKTVVLATFAGGMLAAGSGIPRPQNLVKVDFVATSLGQKAEMTEGRGAVAPHNQAVARTTNYPYVDYNPVKRTCGLHQNQEPLWLSNDAPTNG